MQRKHSWWSGLILALAVTLPASLQAAEPLRIKALQRCGDRLAAPVQDICLQVTGLADTGWQARLGGSPVQASVGQSKDRLRLRIDASKVESGPLWIEQDGQVSNPVWLTTRRSHVLAATEDEVAKNMDGLTTYVDLVSLIIEENHDGAQEAHRLAKRYGAQVVGAIPPLNTYQLRLPVKNLDQRDAMVLRLGNEVSVDAVVIEESQPAASLEGETTGLPAPDEEEWASNRFMDAVNFYLRHPPGKSSDTPAQPVRIGVIERSVDFDSPDFAEYLGDCRSGWPRTCVYARDADKPSDHGTTVAGIFAAAWNGGGNSGFLRGLDEASPGFEVIVERNSDAGITANIAASVNLVEDGARVLNWSWGIHRVGATDVQGDEVDSLVRSGIAMSGYEELLEEFFLWLRREHPDVVVVNSAGNAASFSDRDEYRLPSSFITEQLFVVGGHQRSDRDVDVDDPGYVVRRDASNIGMRVDVMAAACVRGSTLEEGEKGDAHCGTSYATPLVAGLIAAMMSINPDLEPEQLRMLVRRSAMTIGEEYDFESADADDLTAPILPSERGNALDHPDIGRSARLDMHKALDLTVKSLDSVR